MKHKFQMHLAVTLLSLAGTAHAASVNETFSSYGVGNITASSLGSWSVYVGAGSTIGIVSGIGGKSDTDKCLMFQDANGATSTWKPQFERSLGSANAFTTGFRVDFDWYLSVPIGTTLADNQAIQLYMTNKSGPTTGAFGTVHIGGDNGIDVNGVEVGVAAAMDQWNHVTLISDAPSAGGAGRLTLIVTQGGTTKTSNPVAFSNATLTSVDDFAFSLGGGAASGNGVTAYLDNIVIQAVPEPAALGILALGGACLIRRRGNS